jgi:hypothetical protein
MSIADVSVMSNLLQLTQSLSSLHISPFSYVLLSNPFLSTHLNYTCPDNFISFLRFQGTSLISYSDTRARHYVWTLDNIDWRSKGGVGNIVKTGDADIDHKRTSW